MMLKFSNNSLKTVNILFIFSKNIQKLCKIMLTYLKQWKSHVNKFKIDK